MLGGGGSGLQIEPVPLSKNEVNRILSYVNSDVNDSQIPEEREFIVGDIVKIINGPFNNLSGTVSKVIPELKHVIVDIKIFTRLMSVELSYSQVE
jgi:transcriptional antiterminator NusG